MKVDLNGNVAVVTGGGGFIGSAICEALAQNGAVVFVQDFDLAAAESVAMRIREAGGNAYAAEGDLKVAAAAEKLAGEVVSRFGRVDILVNNAGINADTKDRVDVSEYSDEVWNAIMAVDLDGVYRCSKHFSKYMVAARSGRIINIGSVAGVVALRKQCAFVAAKSGMFGLTRAMAADLGQYGVLVNAIAPGSITNADWRKVAGDAALESVLSHIPLGRQGNAGEVAAAVTFLASPEASYITGAMLTVDGGWTCGFMRDW